MSPWTTRVTREGGGVRLELLLTTDPGPMREFRPFLEIELDEGHAVILFGELGVALQEISATRAAATANVVAFPERRRPQAGDPDHIPIPARNAPVDPSPDDVAVVRAATTPAPGVPLPVKDE